MESDREREARVCESDKVQKKNKSDSRQEIRNLSLDTLRFLISFVFFAILRIFS